MPDAVSPAQSFFVYYFFVVSKKFPAPPINVFDQLFLYKFWKTVRGFLQYFCINFYSVIGCRKITKKEVEIKRFFRFCFSSKIILSDNFAGTNLPILSYLCGNQKKSTVFLNLFLSVYKKSSWQNSKNHHIHIYF